MSAGVLTKVVGACCGLGAFAIAVVAGIAADNPGEVVIFRALVSMFVCQLLGVGIGAVVERVISDSIAAHKQSSPDPSDPGGSFESKAASAATS